MTIDTANVTVSTAQPLERASATRHSAARFEENAANVYLAGLAAGSYVTMRAALTTIADLVSPGATIDSIDWGALRYTHTAALRARLAEAGSAATANKQLSALRGTLKAAWRLGQMGAADVPNVKGSKPDQAAGRAR